MSNPTDEALTAATRYREATNIVTGKEMQAIARRISDAEAATYADKDAWWEMHQSECVQKAEQVLKAMVDLGFKFSKPGA